MKTMNSAQNLLTTIKAILALFACATSAHAALKYYEGFDYGGANASLVGKNGGTGFSGAWTSGNPGITYAPVGLTFSDLRVSGGMVTATGSNGIGNAGFYRPLSGTLSGVYYGSFLSKIVNASQFGVSCGMAIGLQNITPGTNGFGILAPQLTNALQVNQGSFGKTNGSTLNAGQTFLILFKIDTTTKYIAGWVLSEEQYDTLKSGGLNEAELNEASIGIGALQVWARVTVTGFEEVTASHLNIFLNAASGVSATLAMDEFRLSDTSLAEVVPPSVVLPPTASIATYAGIEMTGTIGATYRIEYTPDLVNPTWLKLADITLPASPFIYFDPVPISQSPRRFYRVVVAPTQ